MIQYRNLIGDTICAPVTPPGYSGVAVIRVSGEKAFQKTLSILENKALKPETHRSYLTSVVDSCGVAIDQVLVTFFAKGRSFTGDESVEISCHGNPLLINAITKRLLEQGCRSAERGEFSFRAYYNGKIDLVQAESIHDLVTVKMRQGSQSFVEQLKGKLSSEFAQLKEGLVSAMAHLEASIDFVEEDIETAQLDEVRKILMAADDQVAILLRSYDVGKNLNKELKILILGNTNAGKSSLFNKCLESDRAIVTEIAGTTRDLVSGQKFLGSHSVEFIDSAGLRETADLVETIGIQKGLDEVNRAHLIFYVIDLHQPGNHDLLPSLPTEKLHLVFNKLDLLHSLEQAKAVADNLFKEHGIDLNENQVSFVSTRDGRGLSEMLLKVEQTLSNDSEMESEGVLVTQARHFNHLTELARYLESALRLIDQQESPDIISQELLLGLSEVYQILGKEYDDDVLDKIFSQFCIGK